MPGACAVWCGVVPVSGEAGRDGDRGHRDGEAGRGGAGRGAGETGRAVRKRHFFSQRNK